MNRKIFCGIALLVLCVACNKHKLFDDEPNFLTEDFEDVSSVDSLFTDDNTRWSFYQQTEDDNYIAIDTIYPHSGNQCLKLYALPSVNSASKSGLARNHMAFWAGDVVLFTAWFFIPDTVASVNYIFLFDIEESTAIGAGPGIRFALEGDEGFLVAERKKYLESTIRQPEATKVAFPRNKWVEFKTEIKLSQKKEGYIRVWQDGVEVITANKLQTLPKDILYIIQGTKGIYNSIQVGITANSPDAAHTIYLDDIRVEKIN